MNQQQADRIKHIIDNDANKRAQYFDGPHNACVIGGLWLAANHTKEELRRYLTNGQGIGQMGNKVSNILRKEYGLTLLEIYDLQHINDNERFTKKRRVLLKAYIDSVV